MPMLPGAIQLTPQGEAIVLGRDGGLTGGYPVVGVVATSDLDRLALLRTGDSLSFAVCSHLEAARAYRDTGAALARSLAHPSALS
jgi:allophanate hydrolase subunit 2